MRSSFAVAAQSQGSSQITFYYDYGHSESFNVQVPAATLTAQLPQILSQPWLTFHLIDQTVIVAMAKVIKVEIKPPISGYQGEGVFPNSERITSLQRGAVGRLEPTV